MFVTLRAELAALRGQLALQPLVTFLVAAVALCLYRYAPSDALIASRLAVLGDDGLARCVGWNLSSIYCLVLLPLAARAVVRGPAVPSGWGVGNWRLGLAACALFVVFALVLSAWGSTRADFQGAYPQCVAARSSPGKLLIYDLSLAIYFIAWESFFRGYLTLGLEKTFGLWAAFIQMLPFVTMHFDKPFVEALSSIVGGVIVGLLALRTRSFWYGAFAHAVLAIGMDLMVTARLGFR